MMKQVITFPRCVELTGVKRQLFSTPLTAIVDGKGISAADVSHFAQWIVFFRISKNFPFVDLNLPPLDRSTGSSRALSKGNAAVTQAMKYWADTFDEDSDAAKTDSWYALTDSDARAEEKKKFSLSVGIDTRHEQFRKLVGSAAGNHVVIPVLVHVLGNLAGGVHKKTADSGFLEIRVPIGKLEGFDGIVGIDFGNTNTTVVAMGMASGESPQVISCEQQYVEPDISSLTMENIRSQAKKDARPVATVLEILRRTVNGSNVSRCNVNYGKRAIQSTQRAPARAIMGAKRMLSDLPEKDKNKLLFVSVGDLQEPVPAHEPAELYVAKMLEAFMWYTERRPERLAITCPSTFSETEVDRLKATVINARSRALQEPLQLDPSDLAKGRPVSGLRPIIRNCLDEATAAVFFFASREAQDAPGGLLAFNYIYPEGMNILVYDCGGGTTDITLAKLGVLSGATLDVRILGRVGHRTFGGDFITCQYFKVLKVLVCWELVEKEFGRPDEPITSTFDRINRLELLDKSFPTRYDHRGPRTDDVERRAKLTRALWDLAEQLKCLGIWCIDEDMTSDDDGDITLKRRVAAEGAIIRFLTSELSSSERIYKALRFSDEKIAVEKLKEQILSNPDASTWIQELIEAELGATVKCANDLIESQLGYEAAQDERATLCDVHAVYLVGNSSRFPLVRKRIVDEERGLRVRFLAERIRDMRSGLAEEDLKGCVAKGVSIATRCSELGFKVQWDKDLMDKLPYDVDYGEHDPRVTLFKQGEMRSTLSPARIEVSGDRGRRLNLVRRWPGEAKGEAYVSFDFERVLDRTAKPGTPMESGTYLVEYDADKRQYKAYREDRPNFVAWSVPETSPPFVSPQQSGEI